MVKRKTKSDDLTIIGVDTKPRKQIIKPQIVTKLVPRKINVSRVKQKIEAYRSNIGNLFTSNDPTLTDQGWVRQFTDTGYYGDVQKAITIYQQDDLVGGLVDSNVNVANTTVNFDLPSNNIKEAEVWKTWANLVNSDLKSTLPGITMINSQILNSLILTGMAVPDFEWGEIIVNNKTYEFPTRITLYPVLGVKLEADTQDFASENVLVGVSDEYYNQVINGNTDDLAVHTLFTQYDNTGKMAMIKQNAYAIKYRYTHNNQTLYPTPMLRRSFESLALRHKMMDSDISTLELIINKIIQIKVGDKENQPKPTQYDESGAVIKNGDIDEAQELFESMEDATEVIATPYYYEIKIVMPETDVLLDQSKYIQSTFNIYANFGILLDPSSSSNSVQFEQMNLKNWEKNAIELQNHVAGWYTWLAVQILKRNQGKLKALPSVSFDKPDVYDDSYLNALQTLYTGGSIDVFTLLEKYGLEPDKIKERQLIQLDQEKLNPELWKARASFKQTVENSSGSKTIGTSNKGGITDTNKNTPITTTNKGVDLNGKS